MSEGEVDDLLAELVRALTPAGTSAEERAGLFRRARALVHSAIGRDPARVRESREAALERVAHDTAHALQRARTPDGPVRALAFSELALRLARASDGVLRDPAAVLSFLRALSSSSQVSQPPLSRPMPLDLGARELEDTVFRREPLCREPRRENPSTFATLLQQEKQLKMRQQQRNKKGNQEQGQGRQEQQEKNQEESESERRLLGDVVYALQGVDTASVVLRTDGAEPHAVLVEGAVGASVPAAVRALAAQLAGAGAVHRAVAAFVGSVRSAAAAGACGAALLALAGAAERELHAYQRLVAVVDAQRHAPPHAAHALTFLRLHVWLQAPARRLRHVHTLIRAARASGATGGALVTLLVRRAHHGDPALRAVGTALARAAAEPLHAMVVAWLTSGEPPPDLHHELFIVDKSCGRCGSRNGFVSSKTAMDGNNSKDEDDKNDEWRRYVLDPQMVPCYLSTALCKQVLLVGKTVHFVRAACGEPDWGLAAETRTQLQRPCDLRDPAPFAAAVAAARTEATRAAVALLRDKFALLRHAAVLRRALLLAQGDFAAALLDALAPILSPALAFAPAFCASHTRQLAAALESALAASTLQVEPSTCLSCITVVDMDVEEDADGNHQQQEEREQGEENGWKHFGLGYRAAVPLNTVLHAGALEQYRALFRCFLALHRARRDVARLWAQHMRCARALFRSRNSTGTGATSLLLHRTALLRQELQHCLDALCAFVADDVVAPAWAAFVHVTGADNAHIASFDDVVRAHDAYLRAITHRALIAPGAPASAPLPALAATLFATVPALARAVRPLYARLGCDEDGDDLAMRDDDDGDDEAVRAQLDALAEHWHRTLGLFLNELARRAPKDAAARTLLLRLDIDYYGPARAAAVVASAAP